MTGHPLSRALLAAVAVLVVACPCALGLATPLALTVTLGRTAREGIVVRNPVTLETAAKVERVVFDKTGTLTQGRLSVTDEVAVADAPVSAQDMVCLAASVEQHSEHPLAQAIVEACGSRLPQAEEFQTLRGLGASARVREPDHGRVLVGSPRFLGVDEVHPLMEQAKTHARHGNTVVWVGWDHSPVGFIVLRDQPNPSAKKALEVLRQEGVRTVLLSGDDPETTEAIAQELDVTEFEGRKLPEEKAEQVRKWKAAGEAVAMIGDGVNDAPALAEANLSITVAGGTDVAGETSDVVLTHSDLTLIPWFIAQSRRTRRIIMENLGWAFAYNLIAVPLSALGLISPAIAAAAMATSSLLVVGNSLRLRRSY